MDLEVQVVMKQRLVRTRRVGKCCVDSQKFSHYTTLDKLLEEYAQGLS